MANVFAPFRAPIVSSAASSSPRKPKNPAAEVQSSNWWAPIFGWSPGPEYVNNGAKIEAGQAVLGRIGQGRTLFRGCFTEEKAKELRKKTIETSTFHDIMYHSAIASRLASDVSRL